MNAEFCRWCDAPIVLDGDLWQTIDLECRVHAGEVCAWHCADEHTEHEPGEGPERGK